MRHPITVVNSEYESRNENIIHFQMYPSGSGTFSGGPGAVRKGADISLEGVNEWKIQEIGYDGVEKYIKYVFLTFIERINLHNSVYFGH